MTFYALRYAPGVAQDQRKHAFTLGRFEDFVDADDARAATPVSSLLDIVTRDGRGGGSR